jgi:hypothetical protein
MADFDLPSPDPRARPEFADAESCAAWLQELPLINVGPSHGRLLGQLEQLNTSTLAAAERLKIIELLRQPVVFLQAEQTKKFAGRPAPLAPQEREVFRAVIALWRTFAVGYQHCMLGAANAAHSALAAQRALWCIGQSIQEKYKAYYEIDAPDWRALHRVFAFAEERDVADEDVPHAIYGGKVETTCVETYARTLLFGLANPNERPPRHNACVLRWLERWSRKVEISRPAPDDAARALTIDLAGESGAVRGAASGDGLRYLDVRGVARSLKKRIALLRKGEAPAALNLGDDLLPGAAEQLLIALYRQWCEDKQPRAQARRGASGAAQVCSGLAGIQHYVSGERFRQPGERALGHGQHEEIATFGRVTTRTEAEDYSDLHGFMLENMQIKDESVAGLRLERADAAAVGRYQLHQLIAARPADGKTFLLGIVRWLSVSAANELRMGVRTLPGVPRAIAVRSTGLNATAEKYVPALVLSGVPTLQSPESLILPSGWYRSGRVLDVSHREIAKNLTLGSLLENGSDFERVSFGPS